MTYISQQLLLSRTDYCIQPCPAETFIATCCQPLPSIIGTEFKVQQFSLPNLAMMFIAFHCHYISLQFSLPDLAMMFIAFHCHYISLHLISTLVSIAIIHAQQKRSLPPVANHLPSMIGIVI